MTTIVPVQKRQKRERNEDTPEKTSKYYVTNKTMLPAVIKSKEQGKITNELAAMLLMLTRKYAQRSCFNGYTFREDMVSEALANLCQNALSFNPAKYDTPNPFSYYTSCINNSFLQFLSNEKKHRRIRDQLLIDMGENPSFNFQEESRNHQDSEYREDFNEMKVNIEEAKARMKQDEIYAEAKAKREADLDAAESDWMKNNTADAVEIELLLDIEDEIEEPTPNIGLLEFN
jgi:DNA-directed RNA polymerase specialized sigma subunit